MITKEKTNMLRQLEEYLGTGKSIELSTARGDYIGVISSGHIHSAAEMVHDPETGTVWDSPEILIKISFKLDETGEINEFGFRDILGFKPLE